MSVAENTLGVQTFYFCILFSLTGFCRGCIPNSRMSSYSSKQYSFKTEVTSNQVTGESKKMTTVLKDRSWIRRSAEEEPAGDYSETTVSMSSPKSSSTFSSTTRTSFASYSSNDDVPLRRTTSYAVSTEPSSPESKLADTLLPKSFTSSFLSSDRAVVQKDMLCTYCHKPLSPEPKVILDDMKIKCHATCFKCEVCKRPLGHLKAGDSMWVYQHKVHCEGCFDIARGNIVWPYYRYILVSADDM
ncbi:sciellin-like [Arapaima gigas]